MDGEKPFTRLLLKFVRPPVASAASFVLRTGVRFSQAHLIAGPPMVTHFLATPARAQGFTDPQICRWSSIWIVL